MGQLSVGGVSAPFQPVLALLTESGTYTVPYAGWYRIAAIGHGGQAYSLDLYSDIYSPGGAGGMGYVDKYLPSGTVITVTITDDASSVTQDSTTLISATKGASTFAQADGGCLAGTVSGDGVVAAPSNGTATPDITPPDAYNKDYYKSPGGYAFAQTEEKSELVKSGGDGLFGGPGGNGGFAFIANTGLSSGWQTGKASPPGFGGGAGTGGHPYTYGQSTSYIQGSGGGAGFGGGAGSQHIMESNTFADGGAGCVRIERIR